MCAVFRLRRDTTPSLIVNKKKIMSHSFHTPRSVIFAPKPCRFAPIAVAVAAVFAAAASADAFAHDPFVPSSDMKEGTIVLNLDKISNSEDFAWRKESGVLFAVDGLPATLSC